jgi:TonB family protein
MSLLAFVPLLLGAAQVAGPPAPPPPFRPYVPAPPVRSRPIDANYWITTDDYPAAALRAELEGEVTVAYAVSAEGRVTDCTIVRSSGVPVLDSTTCMLITTRARYSPARDHAGRPVSDSHIQRIVWTLPAEMPGAGFVAGYVAASVPVYSESRDACALAHSAAPLEVVAEALCAELPAVLSRSGAGAPTSALPPTLAVISLTGADGRLPRRPQPGGTLQYREEASFEVRPDGTVTNCRSRVVRAWKDHPEFGLCRFLSPSKPFFVAEPAGAAPRPGRMTVELYATEGYFDIGRV